MRCEAALPGRHRPSSCKARHSSGGNAFVQGHQGNGAGNNLLQGQYDNSWQLGQEERMDTAEHAWMQQV